jgi:hypothetical protein
LQYRLVAPINEAPEGPAAWCLAPMLLAKDPCNTASLAVQF